MVHKTVQACSMFILKLYANVTYFDVLRKAESVWKILRKTKFFFKSADLCTLPPRARCTLFPLLCFAHARPNTKIEDKIETEKSLEDRLFAFYGCGYNSQFTKLTTECCAAFVFIYKSNMYFLPGTKKDAVCSLLCYYIDRCKIGERNFFLRVRIKDERNDCRIWARDEIVHFSPRNAYDFTHTAAADFLLTFWQSIYNLCDSSSEKSHAGHFFR